MSTASYAAITALISKLVVIMYQDADEQHGFLNSHWIIENHNELHCNVTHVIFLNVGQM